MTFVPKNTWSISFRMTNDVTIRLKPIRAKIKRPLAEAAASGLPLEVMNWMPEMTIIMMAIKPAMPKIIGRNFEMIFPMRPEAVNSEVGEFGKVTSANTSVNLRR